jgi:hypothetical protein
MISLILTGFDLVLQTLYLMSPKNRALTPLLKFRPKAIAKDQGLTETHPRYTIPKKCVTQSRNSQQESSFFIINAQLHAVSVVKTVMSNTLGCVGTVS